MSNGSYPRSVDEMAGHRSEAKQRRDRLRSQGLCINGALHGLGDPRCEWCKLVHRVGFVTAKRIADEDELAVQPPRRR